MGRSARDCTDGTKVKNLLNLETKSTICLQPGSLRHPESPDINIYFVSGTSRRDPAALTWTGDEIVIADCEVPGALTVLCPLYNTRITVRVTYDLPVTPPDSREQCSVFNVPHPSLCIPLLYPAPASLPSQSVALSLMTR